MNHVKWLTRTSTVFTTGHFLIVIVVSIPTKSMCTKSKGSVVPIMNISGRLGQASYQWHLSQFLTDRVAWTPILGHQNLFLRRLSILSLP